MVLAAAVTLGGGFSLRQLLQRKIARHQARIDDRLAAGKDRYFEELRELQAYDPRRNSASKNIVSELTFLIVSFIGLTIIFAGGDG